MSIPDGNWTELRRLVMKLLEEHEAALLRHDELMDRLSKAQVVDHTLLNELRTYVFGSGGVWTAIKLIQQQMDALDQKTVAQFKAAEEKAAAVARAEIPKTTAELAKSNWKLIAILGTAVTALAAGLGKVLDLLGQALGM